MDEPPAGGFFVRATGLPRDRRHGRRSQAAAGAAEINGMDADLFSPADTVSLLVIRAITAHPGTTPADLRALFAAAGLARDAGFVQGTAEAPGVSSRATEA